MHTLTIDSDTDRNVFGKKMIKNKCKVKDTMYYLELENNRDSNRFTSNIEVKNNNRLLKENTGVVNDEINNREVIETIKESRKYFTK